MKVILKGKLSTSRLLLQNRLEVAAESDHGDASDETNVPIEIVDESLEPIGRGNVLLIHPLVSLELNVDELERALRVFRRGYGPR